MFQAQIKICQNKFKYINLNLPKMQSVELKSDFNAFNDFNLSTLCTLTVPYLSPINTTN